MNRTLVTSGVVFVVLLGSGCTLVGTPRSEAERDARNRAAEQRMTQYFQGDVRAKLRNCWSRVAGQGRIAVALSYASSAGRWTWEDVAVTSSTLSGDQDAIATACLREAVRGTSFPVDATDTEFGTATPAKRFVVNWSLPVPLAESAVAAMLRRPAGGAGSPGSCWYCGFDRQGEPACQAGRSGWLGCIELDQGGCICFGDLCTSGGYTSPGGVILR